MTAQPVSSPCVKVCAVDGKTGLCLGCGRTLPEIGGWIKMGPEGRKDVLEQLPARLSQLRALGKLGPVK